MYLADDDIIEVCLLPLGAVITSVWISTSVDRALTAFARSNDGQLFAKKLKEVAKGGFENFEGGVIRSEGRGVLRIGIRKSLFRILGFYGPSGFKREFIAIEAGFKPGQRRGSRIDSRVTEVANIRESGRWRKVQS